MTVFLPFGSRSKVIQSSIIASSGGGLPQFQVDTDGTLTTGLDAYYKMENSIDIWGGHNATDTTGMTYTAGKVNNAGVFNSSAVFRTGYSPNFGTNDFSVSCWYKATSGASNPILWGNNDGTANYTRAIFIGSTLYWEIWTNNLTYAAPLDGAWHQLTCVRNGGTMTMYIDNTQVATGTANQSASSSKSFDIGSDYLYSTLTGGIDELGIWNKALSTQERTDLYNGGNGQTMVVS